VQFQPSPIPSRPLGRPAALRPPRSRKGCPPLRHRGSGVRSVQGKGGRGAREGAQLTCVTEPRTSRRRHGRPGAATSREGAPAVEQPDEASARATAPSGGLKKTWADHPTVGHAGSPASPLVEWPWRPDARRFGVILHHQPVGAGRRWVLFVAGEGTPWPSHYLHVESGDPQPGQARPRCSWKTGERQPRQRSLLVPESRTVILAHSRGREKPRTATPWESRSGRDRESEVEMKLL